PGTSKRRPCSTLVRCRAGSRSVRDQRRGGGPCVGGVSLRVAPTFSRTRPRGLCNTCGEGCCPGGGRRRAPESGVTGEVVAPGGGFLFFRQQTAYEIET